MHDGLVENFRGTIAQQLRDVLSLGTLLRGAQYQCPFGAQPIDFRFQLLQRALAENDARRLAVIDEG
ncbi:hypothetical protein D9M71_760650 [compost metagenome]